MATEEKVYYKAVKGGRYNAVDKEGETDLLSDTGLSTEIDADDAGGSYGRRRRRRVRPVH